MIASFRRKSNWKPFVAFLIGFLLGKNMDMQEKISSQHGQEQYRAVIEKIYVAKDTNVEQSRHESDANHQEVGQAVERKSETEQKKW